MEAKKSEILERKMCHELELLEEKYTNNQNSELSVQDLEKIDKLYHALKSMATYKAMKESEEDMDDGYSEGMSGRRGRAYNGRYVSRDEGPRDGYGYSGHYPTMYPPQGYPRW